MKPILFILMRSDMDSMNPGKAMAQAAHAATAFEKKIATYGGEYAELYKEWAGSTPQGFGTKIVLDAGNESNINEILFDAERSGELVVYDIINDPTYPIRDGSVVHYIPVNTCAYVFTDVENWSPNKKYSLHK